MTNQELFDKVAAHILKQGGSVNEETGACFYRGPNDLAQNMCVLSIEIADDPE